MALSWPVDAPVTQQFASFPNSIQPNGHTGMDFGVPVGTPIYAADSGNVVFADWANTLSAANPWWIAPAYAGICVVVNHNDGFLTLYAHLNETNLNDGQFVEKGDLIGLSGSTGLSTGPHLHFEVIGWPLQPYNGFYGRLDPNQYCGGMAMAPAVAGNQRVVGQYGAKERTGATTKAAEGKTYGHGDTLTFKGYVRGETANGSNIWFVGAYSGTFFHSSAFDDNGTHDLQDLTPAPAPAPPAVVTGRTTGGVPVNFRKAPNTTAELIDTLAANSPYPSFTIYTKGESIEGNDIWFKGTVRGGYAWSGAFTDKSTKGLTYEAPPVVAPASPAPTQPVTETYKFTPDFDFVEYKPVSLVAPPNEKFQFGNFPDKPEYAVIHQFGTLGVDTLSSLINTFTNPAARQASSHFAISGKRIIQMVSLKDRAYHAGSVGNNYVGIETDPAQDADTIESTKKLLQALKDKYGYELKKTLHKDVPGNSTNCGASVTLSKYDLAPTIIVVPTPTPTPEPKPEDIPDVPVITPPAATLDKEAIIDEFLASLKKSYFNSK